ncbi:hypothetical protein D9758_016994 [Tetrapyrgos nigripes]|uniref:Uncharacterized protein n=1 Tax=Tetrapyrgos nigripes TaxID=182062 RepID=A0A8H5CBJ1_9AGAR|nr:hypothetical protein D9758_016994 [Tetrapyrgos nigripes]
MSAATPTVANSLGLTNECSTKGSERGWALREFEPGNGISLPLSDTPWKQQAMGPGFLIIYSEPGKEGSLNKFQDLYNWHKHVSLPLHHLESFLSGARYFLPTPIFLYGSLPMI